MNKKTLVLMMALAVILIAGIAAALFLLYSSSGAKSPAVETGQLVEHHELIEAVPSDAAIVLCVKDFGRACELLGDSVAVFGEITSRTFDKVVGQSYGELRKCPAIISVHYSKDMPPLLAVKAPEDFPDSTDNDVTRLIATAQSSGLFTKVNGGLILISSSETIVNSSVRHLSEGHSVLESKGFAELASKVAGSDILFASNAYTDKILEAYFARKYRKMGGFFKEIADWTAFSIGKHSGAGVYMHGEMLYGSDPGYYMNVLRHAGTAPVGIADAVPSRVDFVIDLPIGNIGSYLKAYRNYLDAKTRLDKYEYSLGKQKKACGKSAEDWAKALDIKEIAVANIHFGDKLRQILLIKPGNKPDKGGIDGFNRFAGFAKTLFGDIFTGEDESSAALVKGWIVVGASDCVEEYPALLDETLKDRLAGNGLGSRIPQKGCGFWMYHALTEDPNLIDASFSPMMAKGFRNVTKGVNYVPVTLAAVAKGEKMELDFNLDRTDISRSKAPTMSGRDTSVFVPPGPFTVRNSATGKDNKFYQNSHMSICLQDENGKDVWGIPFKYPILGYVSAIDFYNNGKLQYLFAADSKLYLIDRLGRFVSGFPVDLGKKIAVGPQVFDFTGAKGYTAMVLHKDNTVGMYNLHGQVAASWKGITSEGTIRRLPELMEAGGKKYWVVRTSEQALVYPFNGGDPLVKGEGDKMVRPDSKISPGAKGTVTARCYDGKERTFKLDKEK